MCCHRLLLIASHFKLFPNACDAMREWRVREEKKCSRIDNVYISFASFRFRRAFMFSL